MTTISVKLTPPKTSGCRHIVAEYSDGKDTLTQVYHMDELEAVVKLADKAEALKAALSKQLSSELAKAVKLDDACMAVKSVEV